MKHTMKNSTARLHLYISGRVQGVSFRSSTVREARELGVTGRVKNLPDGRVEIVAEGEREKLEKLLEWSSRGPRSARVDDRDVVWQDFGDEFEDVTVA